MELRDSIFLFRGGGDLATGAALRVYGAGFTKIVILELEKPLAVRRTVSFSDALYHGEINVEGVTSVRVNSLSEMESAWKENKIPVFADPAGNCLREINPHIEVEITLAKRNIGVQLTDAPLVIGVGPGFQAGKDVHCVIESNRGINMGRLYRTGSAEANTGRPGVVMGFDTERVLRAPCAGLFLCEKQIGDPVTANETIGFVKDDKNNLHPVLTQISGYIRGLLPSEIQSPAGMKLGDIEPRPNIDMFKVSDKSLAIGGAILEAALFWFFQQHPKNTD